MLTQNVLSDGARGGRRGAAGLKICDRWAVYLYVFGQVEGGGRGSEVDCQPRRGCRRRDNKTQHKKAAWWLVVALKLICVSVEGSSVKRYLYAFLSAREIFTRQEANGVCVGVLRC